MSKKPRGKSTKLPVPSAASKLERVKTISVPARVERVERTLPDVVKMRAVLEAAAEPNTVREIERQVDAFEAMMRKSGLYTADQIRPISELKMEARWKLGQMLAKVERAPTPGKGKMTSTGLTSLLAALDLNKQTALEAQRIGCLPRAELDKALAQAHKEDKFVRYDDLLLLARPYWYQASRKTKHQTIVHQAKKQAKSVKFGPFALLYADPPWKFQTYSEKGLDRTPDQHYPTLTDDEIKSFKVHDKTINEITTTRATLFLWCTSSNLKRALDVMEAWGFVYKTHAVWDKERSGMGLVFRNQHEILLYGTKGAMPGPQYQPRSVFRFPRGKHSAKPAEVRQAIEKMYPDFDEKTRVELFARHAPKGWSVYGYESDGNPAT